jgi:uncharacterized membrane protein
MHSKTMIAQLTAIRAFWLWPATILLGLFALVLVPGGFAEKSRMVLHGLCAQTPGHTYYFGGLPLPFDARMTGIYSGALIALAYLALRGRLLAGELPASRYLAVLAGFAFLMAADGFNSLFTDIGWWHPWESTNAFRVTTGYGMGVAIAVAMVWLLSGTVFQIAHRETTIRSLGDLVWCVVPLGFVLAILHLDWTWLHIPVSTLLMLSAWIVLGTLALVTILLATRVDERIDRVRQLHVPGALGLVLGVVIMLLLAFGRSWLERTLGIPSTL